MTVPRSLDGDEEDYSEANFGFPHFQPPEVEAEAEASTHQDAQSAVVVEEERDRIFNPIVGGHLNFSSKLYEEDYPVRNSFTWKLLLPKLQSAKNC